jgi:heme exporter protein A
MPLSAAAVGRKAPATGANHARAVELDSVERLYGERPALDGVSVRLEEGATLGVLGANGAGKSTLLRVLATLLRPHGGRAVVLGASLPAEAWRVRGRVGLLGHAPGLYPRLSARENLLFHARLHGVAPARTDELLEEVGLGRRAADPVDELSRGMAQRLDAARAVLHDPSLLLLDEPRANLDPAAAERLEPLVGAKAARTRVIVTHDVEWALSECDTVLGLRRGRGVLLADAAGLDAASVRAELYR